MEPGPSGSSGSGGGGSGIGSMPERAVQQMILNPIPGPSTRPYLAQPVQVPPHFLVPPEQLLPHQVRSGIDIGNLFKLLNALQNRIALACGQHQFLRDPLNQPRPPEDGGYKPLTPQAAVRDIRSLCRQQRNLMEKLRRWNCTNDGKCYDLIVTGVYSGACTNCEPFVASRIRMKRVNKALRKQRAKARRKALKKLTTTPTKAKQQLKKKVVMTVSPKSHQKPLLPPPSSPPRKRRKKYTSTEPPHPETFLSQENFLSELGLVTPEVYQKTQAESRRTERRRRTTANPKYKSKVSADSNEVGRTKRSRRSDPSSLEVPHSGLSSPTGAERRRAKQKRYECTVCEKKDVTIQCSGCMSGFHPECIRVTASKAPPPSSVSVCPNCVQCDPSIRSSDCILLSRRMSRPSIMGLKSDPEPGPSGNHRNHHSSRNPKATSRRKTTAKSYSKAARRNASSAKVKKPSFKPQSASKTRKITQNSKKSYSKRTLNHSLAVAAAAAVPAYCTSARSSVEPTSSQKKASGYQQQTQRKRKLDVPAVDSKLHKGKHTATPSASDRRGPCIKHEASSLPLSAHKSKDTATVKKALPIKSLPVAPSDERSNCISKKQATKQKEIQDGVVLSQKNSPTTGCIQAFHPEDSKTSGLAAQQKVDANNRLKKTKLEKMEENIVPVEGDVQTLNKGAMGKNKKGSGSKSGPVDPFCMKRTMMAMSAAAGIVLSSSGIKISNMSSSSPSPAPAPTSVLATQKVIEPTLIPAASPDITAFNNSYKQEIGNSTPKTMEAKVKAVQKSLKPAMILPLTNLNDKVCDKEIRKTESTETMGKALQKAPKPTIISQISSVTLSNTPSKTEVERNDSMPRETVDKPVNKLQKSSLIIPSTTIHNNACEIKTKTYAFKTDTKGKSVQLPKPAIISNLAALKSKHLEKGVGTEASTVQKAMTTCTQRVGNALPLPVPKSHCLDPANKSASCLTVETNGKATQSSPSVATTSHISPVKIKSVDKVVRKTEDAPNEPKVKIIQKSPNSSEASSQTNQEKVVGKKLVTPKAKKSPKAKLDPAVEQSISDTINRVILQATSALDKDEQKSGNIPSRSAPSKNSCEFSQLALSCDAEVKTVSDQLSDGTKSSPLEKWTSKISSEDFNFSYTGFALNGNNNGIDIRTNNERSASPASNSSTIGSPRYLGDLESDDSSDLLSIPDTPLAPYLELKRLEKPGPYLDLSALERIDDFTKNHSSTTASKRGRPSGRGRGGRH